MVELCNAPLQRSFLRVWGVAECLRRACPYRFLPELQDKRVIFHTHLCRPKSVSDRICIAVQNCLQFQIIVVVRVYLFSQLSMVVYAFASMNLCAMYGTRKYSVN